jgi:hypothetical protein
MPAGRRCKRSARLRRLLARTVFAARSCAPARPCSTSAVSERGRRRSDDAGRSAVLFGLFLLTSIYLQEVPGTGALEIGLAFPPMAVIIGARISQPPRRSRPEDCDGNAFALTAAGMVPLAGVDGEAAKAAMSRRHARRGPGLGVALVSVALSVLTGAADDEAGMLGLEHDRP